jgi:CHAT domain-containing protein
VVASPDFNARGSAALVDDAKADSERGELSRDLAGMLFRPLSSTSSEGRTIAQAVKPARVLLGQEATEHAIKTLHGPSLLHIATHGFFLADQPRRRPGAGADKPVALEDPLVRSGLALAGANQPQRGADDGVLTALEVSSTDLYGTGLVVLSACETAVGEVINGEGVYGLRRALVLAGARTQVMSLWRVDDTATTQLMSEYYGRLQRGEGRSEAMRQVQLAMLAQRERAHPYYWASFIVSGDWTALSGKGGEPMLMGVPPGSGGCGGCALELAVVALGLRLAWRRARRW